MITFRATDACPAPSCDPFFTGPAELSGPVTTRPDGTSVADFGHSCGLAWTAEFDASGFVTARVTADVAEPARAA